MNLDLINHKTLNKIYLPIEAKNMRVINLSFTDTIDKTITKINEEEDYINTTFLLCYGEKIYLYNSKIQDVDITKIEVECSNKYSYESININNLIENINIKKIQSKRPIELIDSDSSLLMKKLIKMERVFISIEFLR